MACGSTRVSWRVRRLGSPARGPAQRSILWTCRECGSNQVAVGAAGAALPEPVPLPDPAA